MNFRCAMNCGLLAFLLAAPVALPAATVATAKAECVRQKTQVEKRRSGAKAAASSDAQARARAQLACNLEFKSCQKNPPGQRLPQRRQALQQELASPDIGRVARALREEDMPNQRVALGLGGLIEVTVCALSVFHPISRSQLGRSPAEA